MVKLEGKNITLREIKWADLDDYIKWGKENDYIHNFRSERYLKYDFDKIINLRKKYIESDKDDKKIHFEIDYKDNHIGWLKITRALKDEPYFKEFEIFIMEKEYQKEKIYKEAIELWLDYIFNKLDYRRISLTTWENDNKLLNVLNKLNFKQEGRIRKSVKIDDEFYDKIVMGKLNK